MRARPHMNQIPFQLIYFGTRVHFAIIANLPWLCMPSRINMVAICYSINTFSYLLHPRTSLFFSLSIYKVHLCAHFLNLSLEALHLSTNITHSREDIWQQALKKRDVFCHKFRHHCLINTLDQDLVGRRAAIFNINDLNKYFWWKKGLEQRSVAWRGTAQHGME